MSYLKVDWNENKKQAVLTPSSKAMAKDDDIKL